MGARLAGYSSGYWMFTHRSCVLCCTWGTSESRGVAYTLEPWDGGRELK